MHSFRPPPAWPAPVAHGVACAPYEVHEAILECEGRVGEEIVSRLGRLRSGKFERFFLQGFLYRR